MSNLVESMSQDYEELQMEYSKILVLAALDSYMTTKTPLIVVVGYVSQLK
jgi:hypothetical protein